MKGKFTLKELKNAIKEEIGMYKDDEWVLEILKYPESLDDRHVYTEWTPTGANNDGIVTMKLSNFAFWGND